MEAPDRAAAERASQRRKALMTGIGLGLFAAAVFAYTIFKFVSR